MIAYVESNFVLELAFRQEEHASCEQLLKLAEAGRIELVLPAYCIGEPYERLVRRDRQRRDVHRRLTEELNELGRSAPYAAAAANLSELTGLLIEAGEQEKGHLNTTLLRLIAAATLIPIDSEVLRAALAAQVSLGLSPQDSIVFASVRSRVVSSLQPQCFINKNSKDFLIPEIEEEFDEHGCRLLSKFGSGLSYVRNRLAAG